MGQGHERRLPDAAGDHEQVLGRLGSKPVSQRSPDFDPSPCGEFCQPGGQLADDQVNHVEPSRIAAAVEHSVVQRQRPAQQRIVAAGQPQHDELAGHDAPRDLGSIQPQPERVARQGRVLDDGYGLLQGAVGKAPDGYVLLRYRL